MVAQPAVDIGELNRLIERISSPFYQGNDVDNKRLITLAEKIKNADSGIYYCAMGVYHTLKKEYDKAVNAHELSLQESPSNIIFIANYASSMYSWNNFSKAYELYKRAYSFNEQNTNVLDKLIISAYNAQQFNEINKLLANYRRLTDTPHRVQLWMEEDEEDLTSLGLASSGNA